MGKIFTLDQYTKLELIKCVQKTKVMNGNEDWPTTKTLIVVPILSHQHYHYMTIINRTFFGRQDTHVF